MSVVPDEMKAEIRKFLLENAQAKGITDLKDTDSLTASGVVDSLGIFRLVSFLEENFGLRIGDDEIVQDNFENLAMIEKFVATKLTPKA